MTMVPDTNKDGHDQSPTLEFTPETYVFEQLFLLGYAESQQISVYKKDGYELTAQFRTLTPDEIRDVLEAASKYQDPTARGITERIETLARSIVTLNHAPLVLTKKEQQEFYEKKSVQPSPLVMARIILHDKIKSLDVISMLYEEYIKFTNKVTEDFEGAKKK